ncbi:hypothetical protein [Plantactinospora sp. KBS50]|uniref:hypothetical protein n=1 Tax=Plantactinospora sp. KBS50 TaxID=2024580 RepID=UPI000BAAC984|nr:hypothetical protein [Plantactinospora sp. KBS50]ASW53963.1 hypothetical protein CIK06_06860 [Plantactinospora sp. KBS50]
MHISKIGRTLLASLTAIMTSALIPPAAPAAAAPPAIALAVVPVGTVAPSYEIQIRNDTAASVNTTIRQELPAGLNPVAISHGGHADAASRPAGGTDLSWQVRVPAGGTETVSATLTRPAGTADLTAPACAFTAGNAVPDDCATATWRASGGILGTSSTPLWRRPGVLGLIGAAVLLAGAVALLVRVRRRRAETRRQADRELTALSEPNVYPRPPRAATPTLVRPARRRPPLWASMAVLLAVLGLVGGAALWITTARVSAIQGARQPSSGAWSGPAAQGTVGTTLRESAFEFTVYQVSCPAAQGCTVTVGSTTPPTGASAGTPRCSGCTCRTATG